MWAGEVSWWKRFESEWGWCQLGGRVSKGIPGRDNFTCKVLAPGTQPLRGISSSQTLQGTSREVQELGWKGRHGWRQMSLCKVKWGDLGLQRQTWWRGRKHKGWLQPYVAWGLGQWRWPSRRREIKEETQVWRIDACRNIHTITSVDFPVRRVSVDNRRDIRARGTEGAARQPKASGNTPRQKRAWAQPVRQMEPPF